MRRRALMSLLTCLALAGCGGSLGAGELAGKGRELISCAIGPGAEWSEDCPVERDGELLTVRHADGGFRRFRIVHDGRGIAPADGAEEASILVAGKGAIELSVGQDRYRFPARLSEGKR
ncbi:MULTISPECIES: hypothetical protein [Sphingobium]|uniref:Lipoprotein n=1 Tax=Sphingobium indicum (strain DSM 16413 / CCM 7287 / MTCC 6362 / UT26 / NBRC 101211 / UT26S) TaxID=452662 RepID=D4Z1T1_SPHIU|nr:hypothetical protein SJA_C1-17290 [Sphingobium indicum UT26S]